MMTPPEKVIADKIAWLGDSKPHETAIAVLEALRMNGWRVVPADLEAADDLPEPVYERVQIPNAAWDALWLAERKRVRR